MLVDVGGEWCAWCHILDRFIDGQRGRASAPRRELRHGSRSTGRRENKNEALLSRWPAIKGYPHLFVLDGAGKLVHSQDTDVLESGRDYDKAKFVDFLRQ